MRVTADFFALIWRTLVSPAEVAQRIAGLQLDRATLWSGMALVTITSVLMMALTQILLPGTISEGAVETTPYGMTLILGGLLVMTVFGVYFSGKVLGGTGSFPTALAMVVWLEVFSIVVRALQALVFGLAPGLGSMLTYLGMAVLIWVLVNFVNVLHGFASLGRAAMTVVVAVVGVGSGLALIVTMIGVGALQVG